MTYQTTQFAGFWRRFAATVIDTLFFSVFYLLIDVLFFEGNGMQLTMHDGHMQMESSNGIINQLITIVITILLWVKFLGTPGKLVLGCHVLDEKTKRAINPLQGLVRYLSYLVSLLPMGLGFFWMAWDKKKQGFHDKIAGTVVVYESNHLSQDESQKTLQELMAELR